MASSKAVRLRKRKHILKRHQTEKLHCYTDNRVVTVSTREKNNKTSNENISRAKRNWKVKKIPMRLFL